MISQKVLGLILISLVIGAAIYFGVTKFKQEVSVTASPSPTPELTFLLTQSPTPNQQPAQLPLAKVKRLAQFPGIVDEQSRKNKKAVIVTKKGQMELEVYPEATMAASNFLILAANGFYDGLTFHRLEPDFVVQGGDPAGDGTGGPGYVFADDPVTRPYKRGTVAMANRGPNTNGSQFFIVLSDNPPLAPAYSIFGQVILGMEVVEKIVVGDVMQKVIIQNLH